jgi:hypothetical protein
MTMMMQIVPGRTCLHHPARAEQPLASRVEPDSRAASRNDTLRV